MALRLRRFRVFVGVLAATIAGGLLVGSAAVQPRSGVPFQYPLAMAVPAAIGTALIALSRSALARWERTASRPMRALNLAVTALELALALVALLPLALVTGPEQGYVSAARNLLGFTGLAAIGSALGGPRSSWLLPLLVLAIPPFFFPSAEADSLGLVTFYAQPDSAANALVSCVLLGGLGLALTAVRRRR
ncbi:hypothetical protein [Rathayibacter tanaceti]|uniref:Uncharacterized protein n=2 Tax=Rathayibacter tanaceti TaxID=1671680 RepID=A0A162GRV7_9MICO|nr:hypothetical protein [Rathayibacter tanaceti]KZX21768.1 hypothetical protein ACH61_01072 [Rathayibacter tanaceti]QHC54486.1 hypothetical protein GSU10_01620 [Rathayibacter tanaceti]TCO35023.1 hypothetical protein EV639_10927 [Rathayibacter tanaceti]